VVLLGEHERHDTTQPPPSVTDARQQWITRYLNSRFLRLPEQVEVLVREHHGRDQPGSLQGIHGERHHVERHAIAAGGVQLSDAIAYWWVLDDDARGHRREAGLWASSGHAALRQQLAAEAGELMCAFVITLVAAGWSSTTLAQRTCGISPTPEWTRTVLNADDDPIEQTIARMRDRAKLLTRWLSTGARAIGRSPRPRSCIPRTQADRNPPCIYGAAARRYGRRSAPAC
jgi:hypothetical protein